MKPHFFVLLSGVLTLGFGFWLAENSRDGREIWVSMGAWVLGFWFASSIMGLSASNADLVDDENQTADHDDVGGDGEDEEDDEDDA